MDFISIWKLQTPDFLDTEEKIRTARRQLEESTEARFEELRIAKLKTLEQIRTIILD